MSKKPIYSQKVLNSLTPEQRAAVLAKKPQDPCLLRRVDPQTENEILSGEEIGFSAPIGTVQGDESKPETKRLSGEVGVKRVRRAHPTALFIAACVAASRQNAQ